MAVREKLLFDYGWRFHRGDIAHPPLLNYMATYHGASAESGRGGAAAAYDDSDWEIVDLPHDFVIETKPEAEENEDHGYVRRDNGWYRNYFHLDESKQSKRLSLLFDGVGTECIVWVNGVELLRNYTAGTSFEVDFTDVARFGDDVNVVSVYIDNTNFEGWYYEGGGIYRHVWLQVRNPLHVDTWGVFVCPEYKESAWEVSIETSVNNMLYEAASGTVISRILDEVGNTVALSTQPFSAGKRESIVINEKTIVASPALWSLESPIMYTMRTTIKTADGIIDEVETPFGFRTLEFNSEKGFFLNGKHVKIKGMCVHQEHGGLGVALPDGVLEYRIRRLQEMGCNAIRTAHNPVAPQMLDICDRLGMLIMEENRWLDSAPEGMKQLENMIIRDRNHPCIFMWSMFNEEGAMEFDFGPKIMNTLRTRVHQMDGSRPVTYAQNTGLLMDGVAKTGDLIGINYNNHWYPILHEMYPDTMLFGAETIGYINGRLNEPMDTWHTALSNEYHGGIFAWTGFDYRGEAHWPDVYFRFGAMDPSGCAKDGYHLYQAYWLDEPHIHIATTWKIDAPEGSAQEVRVYTNGVKVELFANGESLGVQDVNPAYQTKWDFSYRTCPLDAVAYDKEGHEIARCRLDNPQKPASIKIVREAQIAAPTANNEDIVIYNVWALDKDGKICDRAMGELIHFSVEGPVKILCVGDGDVRDYKPWGSANCRLRRGHCQIILRAMDKPGKIIIHAESENLGIACEELDILPGKCRETVKTGDNLFISAWRRSPVYEDIKDPALMLDQDPDTWMPCYTSDCEATHAILTDGCVGWCADSRIPESFAGKEGNIQIVFELNELTFELRVESPGVEPLLTQISGFGRRVITLPDVFKPGMPVRLRAGFSPRFGRDQLGLRFNIRWNLEEN